jgi:hypothetical protein
MYCCPPPEILAIPISADPAVSNLLMVGFNKCPAVRSLEQLKLLNELA